MRVIFVIQLVLLMSVMLQVSKTSQTSFYNYDYNIDVEPELSYASSFDINPKANNLLFNNLARSDGNPSDGTQCATAAPSEASTAGSEQGENTKENDEKARQVKSLVQLLYVAQARVQLEASEIKKAQAVANSAQQALEDAANRVRVVTANLQSSQQEVASAAIRAQTAQLQLAAHDQLLFAARQDVDALSTQLVGLQAAETITQPKMTVDLAGLLDKLKQPLQDADKPTPVPTVVQISTQATNPQKAKRRPLFDAPDYLQYDLN